jgi:putative NADPH-quinone reductase
MKWHVEITLTHKPLSQRRKEKALTAAGVPSPIHKHNPCGFHDEKEMQRTRWQEDFVLAFPKTWMFCPCGM